MKECEVNKTGSFSSFFGKIQKSVIGSLLIILTFSSQLSANNPGQDNITLKVDNITIEEVFVKIEQQTNYVFLFSREMLDLKKVRAISVTNSSITQVLEKLFAGSSIKYKIVDNKIILSDDNYVFQQEEIEVTGIVKDETGSPMPGVSVVAVGTTNGTTTNFDGIYSITVNNGAQLQFSFMGYSTKTATVSGTELNISLSPDAASLDEVVVVGYGTQKKKLLTGANLNVKGDDISKLTTTGTMEALQGISPGVSITRSSAQPGAATKVYIRGIGTIGDSSPLYIVDGVVVSDIDYLSPSDIASLDVLKDAASAAIYGSRAANGVILVTTKQGKNSDKSYMSISMDAYMGVQNVYNQPDVLNAQEFMEIQNEALANDGKSPNDYESIVGPEIWNKLQSGWKGTNWFDEMKIKNGLIENYALNITGGSKKSVYSFGASYHNNEGVFGEQTNSDFKRISLRLNSEHILYKSKDDSFNVLKFGENLTYTNTDKPSVRLGNIYSNDVHSAITTNPLMPVYDENGEYQYALGVPYEKQSNPIALMDYLSSNSTNKNNRIVGNFYLELQPIKGLTIRSSYGFQGGFGNKRTWQPAYDLGDYKQAPYDKVIQLNNQSYAYTFTNTAMYKFDFKEKHNFTVLAGSEVNKVTQQLTVGGSNQNGLFNDPRFAYLDNYPIIDPSLTKLQGSDKYGQAILSYFGRASYNYDEKYLITVVARADGSSNFTEENRWGFFPSVSAGWVITNEDFLKESDVISFMKLRASFGENGNQNIGAFQYAATISNHSASYFFGDDKNVIYTGSYPARVPNSDVTWETSQQENIGLDMNFFKSKLRLNVDLYQKDTKDWLVVAPIVATSGTNPSAINGGQIRNKGIELALGWNDQVGDFKYNISTSFAYNDNEVIAIENGEGIIHGSQNVLTHGMSEIYRAQVGFPIGYFWGFQTDGIIQNDQEAIDYNSRITDDPRKDTPTPGDFRYIDQNGDGIIDDNDKIMLGDPNPKYNFGLQISLEYKGFYMNMTGTGQGGMQIAKSYRSWNFDTENYTRDVYDRWHGEGTSNTYPKLASSGNQNMLQMSDFFIEDATYFRISNLTFGYNVKAIKNSVFKGGKVYVSAKNLATFTNYSGIDPEVGYGYDSWASGIDLGMYPQSRTFLMGVNLNF